MPAFLAARGTIAPVAADDVSAGPAGAEGLGVAAVARRLGVATGTLRTWDRRYGLGPSEHQAGHRRRYTASDLARLVHMRRLMISGHSAAQAAATAVAVPAAELAAGEVAVAVGGVPTRRGARPGGGRVVATGAAGPAARGLARAAMSLDGDACTTLLVASIARSGVLATWTDVLGPVQTGLVVHRRAGTRPVEVDHLLRECAETALRSVLVGAPAPTTPRPVLIAAVEPEDHRLSLVALAAALAEARVATRLLGPRLPPRALLDAVSRTGPMAVVLWAVRSAAGGTAPTAGAVAALAGLIAVRPRPTVLLGGPGWEGAAASPGVVAVADVAGAAAAVLAVASGGALAAGPAAPR